jgi:uncharacterized membrane protein
MANNKRNKKTAPDKKVTMQQLEAIAVKVRKRQQRWYVIAVVMMVLVFLGIIFLFQ